jgi:cytochrome c biogenesis protein CcmG, thiol:disulfide interchange protein DsbE
MKRLIVAVILTLCSDVPAQAQSQPLVLQVRNLDGNMQWLTDFKGKVVLLNFWSTTCPPCRVETPWFVEFQKRWEKDGFTVVGVSMDDTPDSIRKFITQFSVNYPMLAGREVDESIQKATGGIWGMPTSFLVGRDGKVLKKHIGLAPKATLEKEISAALGRTAP